MELVLGVVVAVGGAVGSRKEGREVRRWAEGWQKQVGGVKREWRKSRGLKQE